MKQQLILLSLMTGISIAGTIILAVSYDPFSSTLLIKSLLYASLFLSFWGIGALVFRAVSTYASHTNIMLHVRRGAIFSSALTAALLLERFRSISPFAFLIIVGGFLSLEIILNRKISKNYIEDFS